MLFDKTCDKFSVEELQIAINTSSCVLSYCESFQNRFFAGSAWRDNFVEKLVQENFGFFCKFFVHVAGNILAHHCRDSPANDLHRLAENLLCIVFELISFHSNNVVESQQFPRVMERSVLYPLSKVPIRQNESVLSDVLSTCEKFACDSLIFQVGQCVRFSLG